MTEYRIFGPPGTGKTTTLSKEIQRAAKQFGENRLMVASFTRAAAHEIGGRNNNISGIGTLHAHGYRALGASAKIMENCIDEWNKECPQYELSGGKQTDVDETSERGACSTPADELFVEMNMNRALMIPRERWKLSVRAFADRWDRFKAAHFMLDYTDMIEIPYRDVDTPRGEPSVGFFDEAQDFTPLELALVRKWGATMEYIILAGDDDQCIYSWNGARPDVLIEGAPAKKFVLSQSYRVPRAVHALSQDTIRRVQRREPKEYRARDADGEVRSLRNISAQTPERIIEDMQRYIDAGKTVMILASCGYMLNPLIKALRAEGIVFHNPYRKKAGQFNPLHTGAGVASWERLLAFYDQVPRRYENREDMEEVVDGKRAALWYELLKVQGNIARGAKESALRLMADDESMSINFLKLAFLPESGIFQYLGRDADKVAALQWFVENIGKASQSAMQYPLQIIAKRGPESLRKKPQVIVGTIHSVKGGEADVVYVAPDLSYAGHLEKTATSDGQDAVTRLKYVAYTRARESLVLLDSAGNMVM